MNIFWVLFILTSATAFHPVGAALGFSPQFSRYVRIFPLFALLDAIQAYSDLVDHRTSGIRRQISWRQAAQIVATESLRHTMGDNIEGDSDLQAALVRYYLDGIPRLLANIGLTLTFAKMCGFNSVPVAQTLAAVIFGTWAALELLLLMAFGIRPRDAQEILRMIGRTNRCLGSDTSRRVCLLLIYGQLVGFSIAFLMSTKPSRPDVTSTSDAASSNLWNIISVWLSVIMVPIHWLLALIRWQYRESELRQSALRSLWNIAFSAVFHSCIFPLAFLAFVLSFCLLAASATLILGAVYLMFQLLTLGAKSVHETVVRWIAQEERGQQLLVVKAGTLGLLVMSLIACNVFWDRSGTWKEDWTGKLD